MDMKSKYILIGLFVLGVALALAACGGGTTPTESTPCPTAEPCPDCPACPDCPECPEQVVSEIPFADEWVASPHNDATAEAFTHWDEDGEVEVDCAKCHSTPGHLDFLGADGSTAGVVDAAAPIGTTVQCVACHNEVTLTKTSVVFPSGIELTDLGYQSRCMECHQGRSSKVQVDESIAEAVGEDLDTPSADLRFINIHYYAAAATRYGTEVMGGYEYEGKTYDPRFDHVAGYDTCNSCHNPHTLELVVDTCATCHTGVTSVEDIRNIRMFGSLVDYDGDGDLEESTASEIEGLRELLYQNIQAYASEVAGADIVYDPASHPYFFGDANANGTVDEGEEAYASWTGRLVRASYNYQVSAKDPGGFAHGGKYLIQLIYDSIEDLNSAVSSPIDMTAMQRVDAGHFAASEEPFRHWDEDGEVPGDCAKCHSAEGLPVFLKEAAANRDGVTGRNVAVDPASGLNCATCHNDLTTFTRYEVPQVKMPSGSIVDTGNPDSNICLNCHQGRESTVSLNAAIASVGVGDDEVSENLSFRNPHYFAAGATLFGTDAKGAYEYEGKTYNGRFLHVPNAATCVDCHDTHALEVKVETCSGCHGTDDLSAIRMSEEDFDGDGDTTEGMAGELATVRDALYAQIQAYATDTAGAAIVYDALAYPYWYADANANGTVDEGEESFATWTPSLLRAAYNYTWSVKDPGAFAHNGKYILQVMMDSLEDLGGSTTGMTRPVPAPVE
jgi:hypothetical protein